MATDKTKTTPKSSGGCLKKWLFRLIAAAVLYVTCQYLDTIKVSLAHSFEKHMR